MNWTRWFVLSLAAALLTGCAGGGGGGSDILSPTSTGGTGTTGGGGSGGNGAGSGGTLVVRPTSLNDIGDSSNPPGTGWFNSFTSAVNDAGLVTGDSGSYVFYWDSKTPAAGMILVGNHDTRTMVKYNSDPLNWGYATMISPNGVIIGYSTTTSDRNNAKKRGFVYDVSSGSFYDLPTLGTASDIFFSHPVDISGNDLIALTVEGSPEDAADKKKHACIYDFRGTSVECGFLEDEAAKSSEAKGVNNEGWLTYTSADRGYWGHASFGSGSLGTMDGKPLIPVDINNSVTPDTNNKPRPHIVGNAGDLGFFWEAGVAYPIGAPNQGKFEVVGMNDRDQVIVNNGGKAFIWKLVDGRGSFTELGHLGGGTAFATAINNNGEVIGYSTTGETYSHGGLSQAVYRGFLWSNGKIHDLGTHSNFYPYMFDPSYPFSKANHLNNNGDVIGISQSINGSHRGFIRFATP